MTQQTNNPNIEFLGLRIYAERSGYRVTGRVEFPHPVCGKASCPIDYSARRPDGTDDIAPSDSSNTKLRQRLMLVKRWLQLCKDCGTLPKTNCGAQAINESGMKVSYRTLQAWTKRFELHGPDDLKDKYVKPAKRLLTLTADQALSAIKVCCWWKFRVGRATTINNTIMHAAVALLDSGYYLADIIATIDCYYAWPCDRLKFAFKPFVRWSKYDFQKWLYRACDENDYRRGLEAARHQVPLQAPATTRSSDVADPKMRKRETLHRGTRRAIRDLHPVDSDAPRTPVEPLSNSFRAAPVRKRAPLQDAAKLRKMGCDRAADDTVKAVAPGPTPMSLIANPKTIAEALGTLDDAYRRLLLSAAHGNREACEQSVATMPLWWDSMPVVERNNIEFRINAWKEDHPRVTDKQLAARKVAMLLPKIRSHKSGAQKLFPAARIAQ